MFLNDSLGICTCAAAAHYIMNWTANSSTLITPTNDDVLRAYEAITGYTPNNPATDNGAVELEVLKYWQTTGIANHKIGAFVSVNPKNILHLKIAIWLFGGVYTGVDLTEDDMNAVESGITTWQYTTGNIIGGHAIPSFSFSENTFEYITWGAVQSATYDWVTNRTEEAYALISQDWINNTGLSPSGFNMDQLVADLIQVQN
jgi:hypothetical protein